MTNLDQHGDLLALLGVGAVALASSTRLRGSPSNSEGLQALQINARISPPGIHGPRTRLLRGWPEDRLVLFHGTSLDRLEPILATGLTPREQRGWPFTGISLSADPNYAALYANEAAQRDGEDPIVLAVEVQDADLERASADDDAWETLAEAPPNEWRAVRPYLPREPDQALRIVLEARYDPKEAVDVQFRRLGGRPGLFSLALRGDVKLRAPLAPDRILGGWFPAGGEDIRLWENAHIWG